MFETLYCGWLILQHLLNTLIDFILHCKVGMNHNVDYEFRYHIFAINNMNMFNQITTKCIKIWATYYS